MLARRSIQKLLDDIAAYLDPQHLERFVAHLNRSNRDSIEAEWELITLAALASMGTIQYEPDLGGTTRLDVRFRTMSIRFVADVRVVSDDTYDRQNPVTQLSNELFRYSLKLREVGIEGGFDFRVSAIEACPQKGEYKTRLVLPAAHEFRRLIFNKQFQQFLAEIRREPSKVHYHVVNNDQAAVSIVFNPGGNGFRSYSHPAYNVAHDVTHNVVYRALEDKSHQISYAGRRDPGELAGIILCDGGCGMLRARASVGVVPLDRVIRTFLGKSHTVDFVCVVDVVRRLTSTNSGPSAFEARVWSLRHPELLQVLPDQLNHTLQKLPAPVRSPVNTMNHFEWAAGSLQRLYSDYKGDIWMSANSIEISLRATMEYLAGRIDRAQYELAVPSDWLAHLGRNLERGSSITEVSISRSPDRNDDGLVITFGDDADPAMSPFRSSNARKLGD